MKKQENHFINRFFIGLIKSVFFIIICLLNIIFINAKTDEKIYLDSLYATSVALPEKENNPLNLLDGNKKTFWSTMPGAGPNEGFMLEFSEPVYIKKIVIPVFKNSKYESIDSFRIYLNGSESMTMSEFDTDIFIDKRIKTFYFRIMSISNMNSAANGIRYTGNKSAALGEIFFYGKNNLLNILPPLEVKGSINASSSLKPFEAYNPDFLFDSRKDFGWADGHTDKSGKGEFITFTFPEEQTIEKIKIWNGYQRSSSHYSANERVKKFTFGLLNGSQDEYSLEDVQKSQIITLNKTLTGKSFIFTVTDVYKGSSYKDLVISEMLFFNGKNWFKINSGIFETLKKNNLLNSTELLKKIIDREIHLDQLDNEYETTVQSLIIRSNGSFVLWIDAISDDHERHVYADGNWQLLDNNSIKIFGRLHTIISYNQSDTDYDPYSGEDSSDNDSMSENTDSIKIFQDILQLQPGKIISSKGLFHEFTF